MSFSVKGRQYVSVLVGYGGSTAAFGKFMDVGWKYGAQPRRLLTFALGGSAVLAKAPPRDMTIHAVDDPSLVISEDDVSAGRALSVQCAACHGVGFYSPGAPGPDLRESGIALSLDSFSQLLKSGALMQNGMPRFQYLSDEQIRQLHAYIRARAREVLGTRKSGGDAAPAPKL
jgi:quinohemoprotein ethanol dehydrogenase